MSVQKAFYLFKTETKLLVTSAKLVIRTIWISYLSNWASFIQSISLRDIPVSYPYHSTVIGGLIMYVSALLKETDFCPTWLFKRPLCLQNWRLETFILERCTFILNTSLDGCLCKLRMTFLLFSKLSSAFHCLWVFLFYIS